MGKRGLEGEFHLVGSGKDWDEERIENIKEDQIRKTYMAVPDS